jgi:hypothetical protein
MPTVVTAFRGAGVVATIALAAPLSHVPGAAAADEPSNQAGDSTAWSATVGGELRERFESVDNPTFGLLGQGDNDYLLHRIYLSGEARKDERMAATLELVSGLTSGWSGSPPPTQEDPLDVLQAYAKTAFAFGGGQITLRAGRQELSLGSSRLVSVRESPNVRRAFDGIRASWVRSDSVSIDAFAVRPVLPENGHFDDRSSSDQTFWGVYGTVSMPRARDLKLDVYYLDLYRSEAVFTQGVASESRHTVGLRLFGERSGADWNLEGACQWGSFGAASIRAWTLSADVGYTWSTVRLAPRLGVKADAISGDDNPHDAELGTFNPLFPKLPYFSEANLVTPANLLDVQPNLRLSLTRDVTFSISWNGLWKFASADAFYAPPLVPVPGTAASRGRDIGSQVSVSLDWQATDRVSVAGTYVSFEPDSVVQEAGGSAGRFFAAWVQFEF